LGDPSEAILDEAGLQPNSLIVMTSHGHGGLGRLIAGGVATQVLRHASCPTLIIRSRSGAAPQQVSFDRVALTLDGSPVAERALPLAVTLARAARGSLELVRVAETLRDELPSDVTFPRALPPQRAALRHATHLETTARAYLRRVAQELRREGLDVSWKLLSGDPPRRLEEYLTESQPDIVVLATHGHGVLTRWLLGSVADRLMTATDVPLLLLRVHEALTEEFERGLE
jgi:nucleotide-binding universal stress UspA family protein